MKSGLKQPDTITNSSLKNNLLHQVLRLEHVKM